MKNNKVNGETNGILFDDMSYTLEQLTQADKKKIKKILQQYKRQQKIMQWKTKTLNFVKSLHSGMIHNMHAVWYTARRVCGSIRARYQKDPQT